MIINVASWVTTAEEFQMIQNWSCLDLVQEITKLREDNLHLKKILTELVKAKEEI